jgi:hypothetical protein
MPMPLDQWDHSVGYHLQMIEAGAEMCARHTERLPLRPDFRSLAEEEMRQCEAALLHALTNVRLALAAYGAKPEGA